MKLSRSLEAKVLALAGESPAKGPTPAETAAPRRLVIEADVPIRLHSEANARGKLKAALGRKAAVKLATNAALPAHLVPLPATVTLTRFGAKELDDDNLRRAFKAVRDVVAARLGVDDADSQVAWKYRQRAAWVPFVRIRIETTLKG